MKERIELLVLRPTPLLTLDNQIIKFQRPAYDFFIYLAVENNDEYERDSLRRQLFGYGTNQDYFRTGVLARIDKTIRLLCLPETERGVLHYASTHIRVDVLDFERVFQQIQHLSLSSPIYEAALLEGYRSYTGDFLSGFDFHWIDWKQKTQQRLRQQFVRIAENLVRHHSLYGRYGQALFYAERWYARCSDSDLALQYLIWLSLTMQHHSDASLYLEKLADTKRTHPLIGLSAEGWYQLIQQRGELTLDLIGLQVVDAYPGITHIPTSLPSTQPVNLQVFNNGRDIPDLIQIASQSIKAGYLQYADEQLQQALDLSFQSNILGWLSEIYHQQGILQTKLGQYTRADYLLEQALRFPHRAPYLNNRSTILANLGSSAFLQGNYPLAEKFLQESHRAAYEASEEAVQGYVKSTLALVASQTGNNHEAFVHYRQALHIFQRLDHEEQSAYTLLNMAQLCYSDNHINSALDYLARGRKLVTTLRYSELLALWHWYTGAFRLALGDFLHAEKWLRGGMEITLDARLLWLEGAIHVELGKLYLCRGDNQRALKTFERLFGFASDKRNAEYAAKALYGMGLTVMDDAYPAGRNDPLFTTVQLRQFFAEDILKSASDLKVNIFHLTIAEILFERGMPNFSSIKRYRVHEALRNLLAMTD